MTMGMSEQGRMPRAQGVPTKTLETSTRVDATEARISEACRVKHAEGRLTGYDPAATGGDGGCRYGSTARREFR